MSYRPCICNFCGTGCGQFLKTDGEKIIGVAPMQAHPVSKGKLCIRGWHANELLNSKARIKTPLIRENGVLRKASFAEAIDFTVANFNKFQNPTSEIGVMASARSSNENNYILKKLANEALKTPIVGIRSDSGHNNSMEAIEYSFGYRGAVGKLTAIDKADYILIIGSDLTRQNPIIGGNVHYAKMRGARVTTICSVRTQIASLSNVHIQQKPGNKALVVSALAKALHGVRNVNRTLPEEITKYRGYNDYAQTLRAISSVMLEQASGVPYEIIEEEATHLAKAKSVVIMFSSGISGLDKKTIDAIVNLSLLTGKMDNPNSALIPVTGISNLQGSFDMGLYAKRKENDVFNCLKDDSSQLKSLLIVDHDDGVTRFRNRLENLDFIAYVSAFENPIMDLVDVVFPIQTFDETDGTYTCTDRRVQLTQKITEPPENTYFTWYIYQSLANKMGCAWDYQSAQNIFEEIRKNIIGYQNLNFEILAKNYGQHWDETAYPKYGRKRFHNIHISYPEVTTSASYPFALMVGKAQHYWHQNNLMRKTIIPRREYDATLLLYPQGYIEINPDDAKKLNVRDKWPVRVTARNGDTMDIAIRLSDNVQNGTAYVPYFIKNQIFSFLENNDQALTGGEESVVPVRIEDIRKVS